MAACCERDERFERWTRAAWKQWGLMNLPGWFPAEPAETKSDTSDRQQAQPEPPASMPLTEPGPHHTQAVRHLLCCFLLEVRGEKLRITTILLFSFKWPRWRLYKTAKVHRRRGSWCHFCFRASRATLGLRFALWHFHRNGPVEVSGNSAASGSCCWRCDCMSEVAPPLPQDLWFKQAGGLLLNPKNDVKSKETSFLRPKHSYIKLCMSCQSLNSA